MYISSPQRRAGSNPADCSYITFHTTKELILYPHNVLDSFEYDNEAKQRDSFLWLQSKYYPKDDKTAPVLLPEILEIRTGDTLVELDMDGYRAISIARNGKLVSWI